MINVKIQGIQLIITDTVLDIFMSFRQYHGKEGERGGILLGQINELGNKVLICRATVPNNHDKIGDTSFIRNRNVAQQMIEYEYYNSNKKNTYLGEWHTHPVKFATPSTQDSNMIRQQFEQNDIKVDFIFMFIVSQEELYIGMYNGHNLNSVTTPISLSNKELSQ